MRMRTGWVLPLLLVTACDAPEVQPDPEQSEAEVEAVEEAVTAFFDEIEAMDFNAIESTVTNDFEVVEDTLILSFPQFIEFLRPFAETDASITYQFSDFNTEVLGPVGWTRYRNHAVLTQGGETTHFEWIESAVILRTESGWKVDRLQSAPVQMEAQGDAAGTSEG